MSPGLRPVLCMLSDRCCIKVPIPPTPTQPSLSKEDGQTTSTHLDVFAAA
jgi:hypothetical protein